MADLVLSHYNAQADLIPSWINGVTPAQSVGDSSFTKNIHANEGVTKWNDKCIQQSESYATSSLLIVEILDQKKNSKLKHISCISERIHERFNRSAKKYALKR